MFRHAPRRTTLWSLLTVASALPAAALAQDRDAKEVIAYVLTEAGLSKYAQATNNLDVAAQQIPGSWIDIHPNVCCCACISDRCAAI